MTLSDPALQLACALLVLLAPVGVLLGLGRVERRQAAVAVAGGVAGAVASLLGDALAGPFTDPPARILDAALAAAVTATLASLAARRLGPLGGVVLAVAWTALVYQPVVASVIGEFPTLVQATLGAVDFAGALATHVALGGALLVVHLLPAPALVAAGEVDARGVGWRRAVLAAALVLVAGSAWFVGVERVVDAATPRLLLNGVLGIALATTLWLLVERIGWARVTPSGAVAGAWAGWAAVGIGAPFLAPPALVAAAVLGGAIGSVLSGAGAREAPGAPRRSWTVGVLGATAAGGVVTALLADGFGLAATGTLLLAGAELAAVLAIGALSALGGLLCWSLARAAMAVAVAFSRSRSRSAAARVPRG